MFSQMFFKFLLAIFYYKHSSPKIQELVDRAVKSINSGIKYGRNKWGFQAHLVEVTFVIIYYIYRTSK